MINPFTFLFIAPFFALVSIIMRRNDVPKYRSVYGWKP